MVGRVSIVNRRIHVDFLVHGVLMWRVTCARLVSRPMKNMDKHGQAWTEMGKSGQTWTSVALQG